MVFNRPQKSRRRRIIASLAERSMSFLLSPRRYFIAAFVVAVSKTKLTGMGVDDWKEGIRRKQNPITLYLGTSPGAVPPPSPFCHRLSENPHTQPRLVCTALKCRASITRPPRPLQPIWQAMLRGRRSYSAAPAVLEDVAARRPTRQTATAASPAQRTDNTADLPLARSPSLLFVYNQMTSLLRVPLRSERDVTMVRSPDWPRRLLGPLSAAIAVGPWL